MALVNDPLAADPLAPKPKPLGTTAPAMNPIPTTPAAVQPQAASPAPANDAKPSTPTAPTQLGAADPMAFAQKPATNPIPTTPAATQPAAAPAAANPLAQFNTVTTPDGKPLGPGGQGNPYGQYEVGNPELGHFASDIDRIRRLNGWDSGKTNDNYGYGAGVDVGKLFSGVPDGIQSPEYVKAAEARIAADKAGQPVDYSMPTSPSTGPSLTPTNPATDLRSQTIGPGAGLDRVSLAQQLMDNLRQQSEPQYQKAQRDLTQNAAANGQTGSGMFRTSLGDASRQHELDLQNGSLGFLSDALKGSVDDQHWNTNLAERQQAFQQNQQESAFGQQFAQQQLQEALTNGDFNRALQLLSAGNQGNPADTQLALSQLYGGQAGQAGQALSGAIQGRQANQPSATDNIYAQILAQLYGKGGQTSSTGSSGPVYGDG